MRKFGKLLLSVALPLILCITVAVAVVVYSADEVEESTIIVKHADGSQEDPVSGSLSKSISIAKSAKADDISEIYLNKDVVAEGKSELYFTLGSERNVKIYLSGHTIDFTKSANNLFQISKKMRLEVFGDDGDATNGVERGKIAYTQKIAGHTVYIQNDSDILTTPSCTFNGIDVFHSGSQTPFNIMDGKIVLNDCSLYVSGVNAVVLGTSDLEANNTKIVGNKYFVHVNSGSDAEITLDGLETDSVTRVVNADGKATLTVRNSRLSATNSIFSLPTSAVQNISDTKFFNANCTTGILSGATLEGVIAYEVAPATSGYLKTLVGEDLMYVKADASDVSQVSLPGIYKEGMVLQRGKVIIIEGDSAEEGKTVTVSLGVTSASGTVTDGKWSVTLPALTAMRGEMLTISVEDKLPVAIPNVSVGEVIAVIGSTAVSKNMLDLGIYEEYGALAQGLGITLFTQDRKIAYERQTEISGGAWVPADTDSLRSGDVSALGFSYALKTALLLGKDVPVALVNLSMGGGGVASWIDSETFSEKVNSGEEFSDAYKALYDSFDIYKEYDSIFGMPPLPGDAAYVGADTELGSVCYYSMIAPIEGYSVGTVVWHHGNGDNMTAEGKNEQYIDFTYTLMESLKKTLSSDGNLNLVFIGASGAVTGASAVDEELIDMQRECAEELGATFVCADDAFPDGTQVSLTECELGALAALLAGGEEEAE